MQTQQTTALWVKNQLLLPLTLVMLSDFAAINKYRLRLIPTLPTTTYHLAATALLTDRRSYFHLIFSEIFLITSTN
jgi:uncharacterized membrane protein